MKISLGIARSLRQKSIKIEQTAEQRNMWNPDQKRQRHTSQDEVLIQALVTYRFYTRYWRSVELFHKSWHTLHICEWFTQLVILLDDWAGSNSPVGAWPTQATNYTVSAEIVPNVKHPQVTFVQQRGLVGPWDQACFLQSQCKTFKALSIS